MDRHYVILPFSFSGESYSHSTWISEIVQTGTFDCWESRNVVHEKKRDDLECKRNKTGCHLSGKRIPSLCHYGWESKNKVHYLQADDYDRKCPLERGSFEPISRLDCYRTSKELSFSGMWILEANWIKNSFTTKGFIAKKLLLNEDLLVWGNRSRRTRRDPQQHNRKSATIHSLWKNCIVEQHREFYTRQA